MCLAAALLFAACAPKVGNTTKIVGQFSDNTPKIVEVSMGLMADNDILDTTIVVENGRFEFEIPKNLTAPAVMRTGFSELTFLSDGSTITVDPEAGTAVSSNKKGPHARFVAYNEWMDQFTSDYRTKMAEFSEDEDAAEAYYEETMAAFNDYQKEAAKANSDNIVGLYAITQPRRKPRPGPPKALPSWTSSSSRTRRTPNPPWSSSPITSARASMSWSISGRPGAAPASKRCLTS